MKHPLLVYAIAGSALLSAPILYFDVRYGPPPPPDPLLIGWLSVSATAAGVYALVLYKRCPSPKWRPAVAMSRFISFWYSISSPLLLGFSWIFSPFVAAWLLIAIPTTVGGTALLLRGRAWGVALKLFSIVPLGAFGFYPLTGRVGGNVVGDAYPTMAGWAFIVLGVLLVAAVIVARRSRPFRSSTS